MFCVWVGDSSPFPCNILSVLDFQMKRERAARLPVEEHQPARQVRKHARQSSRAPTMVDFDAEERAFLCAPLAETACQNCGVTLEDLRPRSASEFDGSKEEQKMRSDAYEQRRVYKWRLVREEHSRLERRAVAASEQEAPFLPPGKASGERVLGTAQVAHETQLRQMVERQTRALERDLRAEAQRQRMERKQEMAAEARAAMAQEQIRARDAARGAHELLGDVRAARRQLDQEAAQRPARVRPSSAPPSRPNSSRGGGALTPSNSKGSMVDLVRTRAEVARVERSKELEARMTSKDKALERRKEERENEQQVRRLYAEQMRLRHEERRTAVQLATLQNSLRTQRELLTKQEKAERERERERARRASVALAAERPTPRGGSGTDEHTLGDGGGGGEREAKKIQS